MEAREKIIDSMIVKMGEVFYNNDEYKELPKTIEARSDLYEFYTSYPGCAKITDELDSLIGAALCETEKQGFLFGFKKALEFMKEEV